MAEAVPAFPRKLGHYGLIEKIGAGGMGEVYRAFDEHLNREVAVKVLPAGTLADEAARKRFRHEALALSKLNHPNIATVHDFDTQDGVDYLVTELVPGATLEDRLLVGPLSTEELVGLGTQLAQGLAAAHDEGVVHRDVKPSNVRLTSDGRLKILDFGLAKLVHHDTDVTVSNLSGDSREVSGTLPYMAPEQLRGDCDLRTDVYAAGAVLYELATGKRLFPDAHGPQLVDAIFHRVPVPPGKLNPNVPPALEAIILKAVDKNPAHRQQSARELLAEFQRLAPSTGAAAAAAPWVRRWWWPLARRPRAVLASAAFILGAVLVALWIHGRTPALAFAARDFVLIADFDNQTGDPVFDKSLSTAFATSIQQSQFANVYSRQRTREALKRMQKPGVEKVDEPLAQEIALREGLKVIIVPSISGIGQSYRVAASLRDVASGRDIKSEVFKANGKDGVLDALDKLAAAMRRDLGESLQAISKTSRPLTSVTTSNLEALRQYSIGIEKHIGLQIGEARVYYENALRIDPSFTAAQASLGMLHIEQAAMGMPGFDPVEGRRLLGEAVKHVDGLTDQEKYGILAFHANAIERNPQKAISAYKTLIGLYPDDPVTHSNLGWLYFQMGRTDEALAEDKQAVHLDPKFMLAHGLLLQIYLSRKCELGQALQTANVILGIDPRNVWARDAVGWIALGKGDLPQATAMYEKAVADNPQFNLSRFRLAYVYRLQRRYQQAIETLQPIFKADPNDTAVLYDLGVGYAGLGDRQKAREFFSRYRAQMDAWWKKNPKNPVGLHLVGVADARLGQTDRAAEYTRRLMAAAPGMHFEAAALLSLLGRKKEAVDQLELAVRNGYSQFIFIKAHPDFEPLHGDPRFEALLQRGIKP